MSPFNKDRLSQRQFKQPKLEPTRVNGLVWLLSYSVIAGYAPGSVRLINLPRQATFTKPPSNEMLVFGVPVGTRFAIPADQAFIGELCAYIFLDYNLMYNLLTV